MDRTDVQGFVQIIDEEVSAASGRQEYKIAMQLQEKRRTLLEHLGCSPICKLAKAIQEEIASIDAQAEQSVTQKDYAAADAFHKMKTSLLMASKALPTLGKGASVKARAPEVQAFVVSMENAMTAASERKAPRLRISEWMLSMLC